MSRRYYLKFNEWKLVLLVCPLSSLISLSLLEIEHFSTTYILNFPTLVFRLENLRENFHPLIGSAPGWRKVWCLFVQSRLPIPEYTRSISGKILCLLCLLSRSNIRSLTLPSHLASESLSLSFLVYKCEDFECDIPDVDGIDELLGHSCLNCRVNKKSSRAHTNVRFVDD